MAAQGGGANLIGNHRRTLCKCANAFGNVLTLALTAAIYWFCLARKSSMFALHEVKSDSQQSAALNWPLSL